MLAVTNVQTAIENADAITIVTHMNPDADTLGTALGIYALLVKDKRKKVEVVNISNALPIHLDFLPYYKKIKHKIEYDNSLIISCDCATMERLGFSLDGRDIINIDHHRSNTHFGTYNIVMESYASASQVAFELFSAYMTIPKESAICFYAALLSDTHYFTAQSVNEEVFDVAKSLIVLGANPSEIAYHFKQRKPLSALRILAQGLDTLTLHKEAQIATVHISKELIKRTGATVSDMEGLVDYAVSLVTVEIGICLMELPSGIRVSVRSKRVDVSQVAAAFKGGGHRHAAGFTLNTYTLQESMDIILIQIQKLALL